MLVSEILILYKQIAFKFVLTFGTNFSNPIELIMQDILKEEKSVP